MSIIALLTGGIMGTFAALFAMFGLGVSWPIGAAIYFATSAFVSLPMIVLGTLHRHKNKVGPSMDEWEREFHSHQPSYQDFASSDQADDPDTRDDRAA